MLFGQQLNSHRMIKRFGKALIRLRECAGWSEPLPVADNTLLEISRRGSFTLCMQVAKALVEYVHMHRLA